MTLQEYLRRIMEEKNLSSRKIAKLSGGKIGHATVSKILAGKVKRPSLEILQGLAKGISEPENDVFGIVAAGNLAEEEEWTPKELAKAIAKIVSSPELTRAVKLLLKQTPQQTKAILPVLEKNSSNRKGP